MKKFLGIVLFVLTVFAIWFYVKHQEAPNTTQEKVLLTANEAQIKGFDPMQTTDVYATREIAKVYEGLLEYHYLKRPFELVANLAENMPSVSADQLVYTFKLREGIQFHDNPCFPDGKGRELTAHDFVYTFKRLADPKLQSLNFWLIDNKLQGLNEWRQRYTDAPVVDYTEDIPGVQAIDRYTLQFTLTKPCPQFLYVLAMVPCYAVAHEAVHYYGSEFMNHPVGTGPFTTPAFNPQDTKIVYHKNPTFRDKRFPNQAAEAYKHMLVYADKPLPFVDKIITYICAEEQPRWLKFKKGQLDVIDISRDNIALEVIRGNALVQALQQKGIQLFRVGEASTNYVTINFVHALFKNNPKLRQAMYMAFDAQGHNSLFYNNTGIPAQSIIPPGLAGYRGDYVNPYQAYELKKAKQYLAEAGYPGGKGLPIITLDVGPTTAEKQKGEFFQKCMKKIGIQIKVIGNIFPELLKKIQTNATMLHAIGWSADYPDAENFLQIFYTFNQASGAGSNFNDPAFNALYEKATALPDSPARTVLYERLNEMVAESVPCICIAHPSCIVLQQGWVKNYNWSNFHYGVEQYFDIDLEQKKVLSAKL